MKADVNKNSFKPEKHFTGVIDLQGRVKVASDANEQVAINSHRFKTEALDVIGMCGVPVGSAGFGLRIEDGELLISAGRMYVEGILCENERADLPVIDQPDLPGFKLPTEEGTYVAYADVWQRHITVIEDPEIREVALNGLDTTSRLKTICQVRLLAAGGADVDVKCSSGVDAWNALLARSTGTLRAQSKPGPEGDTPCDLPSAAGFRRTENQLYRVEVHAGTGAAGGPTFVWSRENGSVVVPWIGSDGDHLSVSSLGRDSALGFHGGDWIELIDDGRELRGEPGALVRIRRTEAGTITIDSATATGSLDFSAYGGHPRVRRWDSQGPLPISAGSFVPLEDGVEVQFDAGTYRTGDFWTIPARSAIDGKSGGDIEWVRDGITNEPLARASDGVEHHYCRLAVVRLLGGAWSFLEDCRQQFFPLTALKRENGIHVTEVTTGGRRRLELANDSDVEVERVVDGIDIRCDREVDTATISRPTCYVTVEFPFGWDAGSGGAAAAYSALAIAATVESSGHTIRWKPSERGLGFLQNLPTPPAGDRGYLARLTLKGNYIRSLSSPVVYLDGNAFGSSERSAAPNALKLPSGDGQRGGDFETWFWLKNPQMPPLSREFLFTLKGDRPDLLPTDVSQPIGEIRLIGRSQATVTGTSSDVPRYNIQVFLPIEITSKIVEGGDLECILTIDGAPIENNSEMSSANRTGQVKGVGGAGLNYKDGSAPNLYRAKRLDKFSIVFNGVLIDYPGSGFERLLTISNLSVNLASIRPGSGFFSDEIMADVHGSPPGALVIQPAQVIVGKVSRG